MIAIPIEGSWLAGIIEAYQVFRAGIIEDGIIKSTKASWEGRGYSVELLPSGDFNIIYQVGNLYVSPGVILKIPPCSDSDWNENENLIFFDNAIENFDLNFEEWKSDYLEFESLK
jgi:hypothetical protein